MNTILQACLVIMGIILTACSQIPNVKYSYYLPKAETFVEIIQTADCSAAKEVVTVNTANVTTKYSSDTTREKPEFPIKEIGGWFINNNAKFSFTDDGRLKAVNAKSVGKGEDIIKAGASFATSVAPLLAMTVPIQLDSCSTIQKHGGGKPVNLKYMLKSPITFKSELGQKLEILPDQASEQIYKSLKKDIPNLFVKIGATDKKISPVIFDVSKYSGGDFIPLTLNEVANVHVEVTAEKGDGQTVLWSGNVVVPLKDIYIVPIPKSALFGTQIFELTLSEAGTITSINYEKDSGTAQMTNALNSIVPVVQGPTSAQQANQIKSEADIIAQQQRLARCKANPSGCNN